LGGGNNTNIINNNINNVSSHVVNGGWGGGGWGGGYGGGWGGGFGGGGYAPFYGNWYRGGWGNSSSFWGGFGAGALTSFGMSSLFGGYGGYGYGSPYGYSSMGVYNYLPSWGVSNFAGWGLGSYATSALYSNYTNPYYATVVAAQPAQTTVVYDYSQPINVTSTPPDASVAESTEQVFSAARDSFKAGDYPRALELTDQVLKQTPDAAVVHEFRALCLFALKRYEEATAVAYAVLTAGPGWNWPTLVGLYPDVDTYTNQLRALEAYVNSNPTSASGQFLLAYHYLAQGNNDAAGARFQKVADLVPTDQLSAGFAKLYKKATEVAAAAPTTLPGDPGQGAQQPAGAPGAAPTGAPAQPSAVAANQPPAEAPAPAQAAEGNDQNQQPQPPPPPPANLVGVWKAQASPDVAIALTLDADGKFAWEVDTKGNKQTLEGVAGFQDNTLALLQQDGPPLIGKVTPDGANKFVFAPDGAGNKAPGLSFTR
jgi:tetratricopeptide (TPR) repeat protein